MNQLDRLEVDERSLVTVWYGPERLEPRKMDENQAATLVNWLAELTVVEIRFRQLICQLCLERAANVKNPFFRSEVTDNLKRLSRLLSIALDIQQFGPGK